MTDKLDGLLGDKNRRRFFRHACTASLRGDFEYDRSDKWSGRVRQGYLKTDALAQRHLSPRGVEQAAETLRGRLRRGPGICGDVARGHAKTQGTPRYI